MNIIIKNNQIEKTTARAYLIKFPNNSEYKGYKFWIPSSLVKIIDEINLNVYLPEDFEIKAFKNGNGKHNKFEKIAETNLSTEEMTKIYNQTTKIKEETEEVKIQETDFTKEEIKNYVTKELNNYENITIKEIEIETSSDEVTIYVTIINTKLNKVTDVEFIAYKEENEIVKDLNDLEMFAIGESGEILNGEEETEEEKETKKVNEIISKIAKLRKDSAFTIETTKKFKELEGIEWIVKHETEKAILLTNEDGKEEWIPFSQIKSKKYLSNAYNEIVEKYKNYFEFISEYEKVQKMKKSKNKKMKIKEFNIRLTNGTEITSHNQKEKATKELILNSNVKIENVEVK